MHTEIAPGWLQHEWTVPAPTCGLVHETMNLVCLLREAHLTHRLAVVPSRLELARKHNFGIRHDWRWEDFYDFDRSHLTDAAGCVHPLPIARCRPDCARPLVVEAGAAIPEPERSQRWVVRHINTPMAHGSMGDTSRANKVRIELFPSPQIAELARETVAEILSSPGAAGGYFAMHIRRTDMLRAYPARLTEPERIRSFLGQHGVPDGSVIWLMSDERDPDFWEPLKRHYRLVRYWDFPRLAALVSSQGERRPDNYLLFATEAEIAKGTPRQRRIGTLPGRRAIDASLSLVDEATFRFMTSPRYRLQAGRLDEAEALARKVVARFPEHTEGYLMLARVAMHRRDWALARERWAKLRDAFPQCAEGFSGGAKAAMEAGRLDEAEALAREVVARFPEHTEGHLMLARVAMRRRDWTRARERWAKLRDAFPLHADGFSGGAKAAMEAGRLDEAEALAREAVARFPEFVWGHLMLARVAMHRRDWALARERWAKLRDAFPQCAEGFSGGAKAAMEAGRLDEAEALAREAVARFPEFVWGHRMLARVAMHRRDWALARERWAKLRDAFPQCAEGFSGGAKAAMEAGRLDEAETLAREAVARFPEHVWGHLMLARVTMRRRDWAGLIFVLVRAAREGRLARDGRSA